MSTTYDINESLTSERIKQLLESYEKDLQSKTHHHLGYPYNLDFDFSALKHLVDYSINNLGDPFIPSNYGVHSRPFEIAVLKWFAKLWDLPDDNYWGYITACGTEGNLHGIWLGREMFDNRDVVLLGSTACHYSVWKAGRMYNMISVQVSTEYNDTVNLKELERYLSDIKLYRKRIIYVANIGSTVKGAVDDLSAIITLFDKHGYVPQKDYLIHVDGALFGMMLPFLSDTSKSILTFQNPAISSISVSGHKFIGSPVPCGVIMTRLNQITKLSQHIAYINSRDATILGSRNGHAPLFLWYSIAKKGISGFEKDVKICMDNARYMADKLEKSNIKDVLLNELSCTVVFERPKNEEFVRKWQLACQGDIAHVVVMPNVTKDKIDEFITELIFISR